MRPKRRGIAFQIQGIEGNGRLDYESLALPLSYAGLT
jgi:hypothetical protein